MKTITQMSGNESMLYFFLCDAIFKEFRANKTFETMFENMPESERRDAFETAAKYFTDLIKCKVKIT